MLRELIREIEAANGAARPSELARRLGVERSAIDGMIDELVRLGRLGADPADRCPLRVGRGPCGRTCGADGRCPLPVRLPAPLGVVHAPAERNPTERHVEGPREDNDREEGRARTE